MDRESALRIGLEPPDTFAGGRRGKQTGLETLRVAIANSRPRPRHARRAGEAAVVHRNDDLISRLAVLVSFCGSPRSRTLLPVPGWFYPFAFGCDQSTRVLCLRHRPSHRRSAPRTSLSVCP